MIEKKVIKDELVQVAVVPEFAQEKLQEAIYNVYGTISVAETALPNVITEKTHAIIIETIFLYNKSTSLLSLTE